MQPLTLTLTPSARAVLTRGLNRGLIRLEDTLALAEYILRSPEHHPAEMVTRAQRILGQPDQQEAA